MNILLIVSGSTPQIITETVYGLYQSEEWVPDEIQVLTTSFGIDKLREKLLTENSPLVQMCAEYGISKKIRFDESCIHIFQKQENGQTVFLDDIKTEEDNEIVANALCQKLRELTADDENVIRMSICGGRKAMSYYAGSAMSLYGRAKDKMSHVLVTPEFEQIDDFYYPSKESKLVVSKKGNTYDAKDAEVWLMDLPFVRLRSILSKTEYMGKEFSEMVSKINVVNEPIKISLDTFYRTITVNGDLDQFMVTVPPIEFAFLWWFADLAKNQPEKAIQAPNTALREIEDDLNAYEKFDDGRSLEFHQYHCKYLEMAQASDYQSLVKERLQNSKAGKSKSPIIFDKDQFSQIKSRLKNKLAEGLSNGDLVEMILPINISKQGFKMPLESQMIEIDDHPGDSRPELEQALNTKKQKK